MKPLPLYCARCDAQVPEGAEACANGTAPHPGNTGRAAAPTCGSRAFYRGEAAKPRRHVMGRPFNPQVGEAPPATADAPVHARPGVHGRRHGIE